MKIRLGDLRRIIREVAGDPDPHQVARVERAALLTLQIASLPRSIADSFYRRVAHELPRQVVEADAKLAFQTAVQDVLGSRTVAEMGDDAAVVAALVAAFEQVRDENVARVANLPR